MVTNQQHIVIIGAGFAGLKLANQLRNSAYRITLIDRHNYHQFQPLMYQVATARLEPSNIAFPLRREFQHSKNVEIRIAKVDSVDTTAKILLTSSGSISYDHLVVAFGCTTNYYGNKNVEANAIPMKSIPEAVALRNRILQTFEDAQVARPDEIDALMNFVVVGGGPTGVELSGALAEMKKYVLPKDYPNMDFSRLQIFLLEGLGSTLGPMSKVSQQKSQQYLEKLGVKVMVNTLVEDYDGHTIQLKGGNTIISKNLIWGAGVTGNVLNGIPRESMVRGNRLKVNRFFEVEGLSDVYAIGDIAYMETEKYPKGHPQLANVAGSQAKLLAEHFEKKTTGNSHNLTPFEYKDKGSMATVGKRKAVVDLPGFSFQGRFAWFTWMFVHLMLILGIRNKISVFLNWMNSYFSNDSTLRLILHPEDKKLPEIIEKPVY